MPLKASVEQLCQLLGKTRGAYYDRRERVATRYLEKDLILMLVSRAREDCAYGVRSLMDLLGDDFKAYGIKIGRDRLFDLLRRHNLLIRPRRRYVRTTNSHHHYRKWTNLISDLEIDRPEMVWVSDITYIRTQSGFLYLSLITDAYSRKVVGYHLSHKLEARGASSALRMAIKGRQYPETSLIHHSDRGVQYCCTAYTEILQKVGIGISMGEKGNPYENAIAERINRTFKDQLYMGQVFEDYAAALKRLVRAVYVYNNEKPHSSCDKLTPEQAHKVSGPLARHWKSYPAKSKPDQIAPQKMIAQDHKDDQLFQDGHSEC